MSPIGQLAAVTLDAQDPKALAEFYSAVTGWQTLFASEDFAYIGTPDGSSRIGFQRVESLEKPSWPGGDKQMHLDFSVGDLDESVERLTALGATKPDHQPGGEKWVVLIDPAGHPFCVTNMA
ncbi:VOC family protein [Streptomyces olivaceus]|uniref:VOC family protein n=1 Tax=Streptomyces TaxID=1883 RepID=UPI001CCE25B6|nr:MULTISPECIES: VOC family protein [Streptomyces]MBZ6128916.1 VOC family protein [Streptomyces olivaceus]MBZ6247612.1 VOC family protein [Streptomyces olivaceus]MCU8594238.1 VOC family protein [Streptomyces sp. A13(2022)]